MNDIIEYHTKQESVAHSELQQLKDREFSLKLKLRFQKTPVQYHSRQGRTRAAIQLRISQHGALARYWANKMKRA
jgi:hypothetical protein